MGSSSLVMQKQQQLFIDSRPMLTLLITRRGNRGGGRGKEVSFLAAGQLLSVYFLEFSSLFSFNKSLRFSLFFPSST